MSKPEYKRPEILAPCGNPAAFHAALSAGADAMYLAMDRFGARAYAGNFQQNELLQAIEEAHLHDRKIYLTLNTLLKNDEIKALPEALDPLYEEGLDAVLVQDFGVYRFLRERYPELPLHASTQMNLCSVEGAKFVKSLGFTRVVPARELSLHELREIRELADIEVEAFVHGAMCVCYSGRCYLSSFAGGRSGNRGRCAQPCREMYNGFYPLSMKDLCTLEDVPALMEAGIDSLKIEGRMKNEYYVAACVDAYRSMVEDVLQGEFCPERAAKYRERLTEVFHRGGFTRGYLNQFSGPDMMADTKPGHTGVEIGSIRKVGDGTIRVQCEKSVNRGDSLEISASPEDVIKLTAPVDSGAGSEISLRAPKTKRLHPGMPVIRVRNAALMKELEERFLSKMPLIPVKLSVKTEAGKPFQMIAAAKNLSVTIQGSVAEEATGRPITDETLKEKIGGLSGTGYALSELLIDNDGQSFLPVSEIKNLRRDVLRELRDKLLEQSRRTLSKAGSGCGLDAENPRFITPENLHDGLTELSRNSFGINSFGINSFGIFPEDLMADPADDSGNIVFVSTMEQAAHALKYEPGTIVFDYGIRYMDPDDIRSLRQKTDGQIRFLIGFPYIYRTQMEARMEELLRLALELDGAYVNGIDSFAWLKHHLGDSGWPRTLYLGDGLYRYNDRATDFFCLEMGLLADDLWLEEPCELSLSERREIYVPGDVRRTTTVYGHLPLMLTVQRNDLHREEHLTGARGQHLILLQNPEMCYNILLSGLPVLQDTAGEAIAVRLTTEDSEEVDRLLGGELDEFLETPKKSKLKGIRHRGLL